MHKVAISVGDLNGVGAEIFLRAHEEISEICEPLYCANKKMLSQAANLLDLKLFDGLDIYDVDGEFDIKAGEVCPKSGRYSYDSFMSAIDLAKSNKVDAICTMPINKEAWSRAGIKYRGHTEVLRDVFGKDAIMMLGCEHLFVALFTEHIPLCEVFSHIKREKIYRFLVDLHRCLNVKKVGVLALNPHGGEGGVLGVEEIEIESAIEMANKEIGEKIFFGAIVPDVAFIKSSLKRCTHFVAMYHDQGLSPLKSLYFESSINVSLNLPIIRTSVDHGSAFDIAYKGKSPSKQSYINAINYAITLSKCKRK